MLSHEEMDMLEQTLTHAVDRISQADGVPEIEVWKIVEQIAQSYQEDL